MYIFNTAYNWNIIFYLLFIWRCCFYRRLCRRIVPLYFLGVTEEHHENPKIVKLSAEIRIGYLSNTSQKCYRVRNLARWNKYNSLFSFRNRWTEYVFLIFIILLSFGRNKLLGRTIHRKIFIRFNNTCHFGIIIIHSILLQQIFTLSVNSQPHNILITNVTNGWKLRNKHLPSLTAVSTHNSSIEPLLHVYIKSRFHRICTISAMEMCFLQTKYRDCNTD
jgi:hypothetical protein